MPFRLHQRIDGSRPATAVDGTVVLRQGRTTTGRSSALEPPVEGLEVPSEGGAPAAEAPVGLFVGAIGVSVLVMAGCTVAVRAAGRGEARAAAST